MSAFFVGCCKTSLHQFCTKSGHSDWADSAYMDKKRKATLKGRGVFCGIIQKRVRGQAELTQTQKWHNRLVAGIGKLK